MLFSIVTVTLNNAAGLQKTWRSIKRQSCANYEWIVIDGDSADSTKVWLETSAARWISEPDNGIYDAMNKGIERARGDYILFLNAGDRLAGPHTLARLQRKLFQSRTRPDFIYGDALEEIPGSKPAYKKARNHSRIAQGLFTHHQAMFYRNEIIGAQRYDTSFRIAADYKFTVQFLEKSKEILLCPFPLCLFESGGISQQQVRRGRIEQFKIRSDYALCPAFQNIMIFAQQTMTMGLRRLSPRLYWRLRQTIR